jgi:hypothetical protein
LSKASCLSISTVPLNAEINHRHQEGRHSESVAPVSGLGDELEELEILFVIEPQKRNGNGEDSEGGVCPYGNQGYWRKSGGSLSRNACFPSAPSSVM